MNPPSSSIHFPIRAEMGELDTHGACIPPEGPQRAPVKESCIGSRTCSRLPEKMKQYPKALGFVPRPWSRPYDPSLVGKTYVK